MMMMEGGNLGKKNKGAFQTHHLEFSDLIFSWSLEDILNEELYKLQVEEIPFTFQSEEHYLGSFVYPLLEETRAELASSMDSMDKAPHAEVLSLNTELHYHVTVDTWKNRCSECGKKPYRTLPGDLILLVDGRPESVSELQHLGRTWTFALVNEITDNEDKDDITSVHFKAEPSKHIEFRHGLFVIFLMNITTQKRIWNSLHMHGNLSIIKEVLYSDSTTVKENCDTCSYGCDSLFSQNIGPHGQHLLSKLNDSQRAAIVASLCKTECYHSSFVEQIWGPPGTGKTTTVSVLLFILLQMQRRTLTCAPTNVAIVQVASRVLNLVRESFETRLESGESLYSVGDVLLFGSKERVEVSTDIEDIYMEERVKRLTECLGPLTGWRHCIRSMIDLLESCVSQYHVFVENELFKEQLIKEKQTTTTELKVKPFIEFVRDRFNASASQLGRCILTLCTHIPRSFMGEEIFQNMVNLLNSLSSLESLLFQENLVSDELEEVFTFRPLQADLVEFGDATSISFVRVKSLSLLKTLLTSLGCLRLPSVMNIHAITDFCFKRASLIFCTCSSSYKLHTVDMDPLNLLVIDEAAQLKEAESTIPLQLPGIQHAILIGDECQLPAMVSSRVCIESFFERSLFYRLSSLGHSKHLLNIQYRMHPSISFFPNWKFYQNQILDAENVTCTSYEKRYLSGPMFGPYSFINVVGGSEEKDEDDKSLRNMVEVAIVIKMVKNLYRAWIDSKKKLSIGIVSPYAAQVVSIQQKLSNKYEKLEGFSVKVKSIDGFQGGEEDIIILSTVRSNRHGSVGFLCSPQRTNVAVTRARHCLWILGDERTLTNSDSVWKALVLDAKKRHCFFDADADEYMKMTIVASKKELQQFDDLVKGDSVLFKDAKWKVLFSDDFRRSFAKLSGSRLKKLVLNLLLRLSSGWRPKNRSVDSYCGNSSQILKKFKVEGLYVICTIDIINEFKYIQVLKVWDILHLEEIPKLSKRLENIFAVYTDDYINRCTEKCLEGNLEIPKSWVATQEIIRFRTPRKREGESEASMNPPGDGISYVENSKVSESLLLMKFYHLSSGAVNHLLSGKEHDLPMQVTDEQMEIILFSKSSFIIGRSGTGKTTILTMKLFQKEESIRVVSDGFYAAESSQVVNGPEGSKRTALRQLFVTVSPRLCYAVRQQVSYLTRCTTSFPYCSVLFIACNGDPSTNVSLEDADVESKFTDIPDTFVGIPGKNYPLVLTFDRFLMMLDATLGDSFFERFLEAGNIVSRSVGLKSSIRSKKVSFERFCTVYWPRFNSDLTKKLDPSRVFTEITSHIKGGLQVGDGKLSHADYSSLSESRASTLTKEKRGIIYKLFEAYEKMKSERGEFDSGDFVNDLHRRLRNEKYKGDQMDFVYIDEVQDLSMRQISLFKYICQNVEEGYIFAGDTAQTIARGIDFRFQDIRSLFYEEFLSNRTEKQKKGVVSEIFQLKQNFRTHAGVLDLAQSVIEILTRYFAHSIDILEPETSLISGEAPVLLEPGNDENAIVTIFGGSGSGSREIAGFGAEQVILVRDDCAKTEICEYVGKQALILTIVECKGLEFQVSAMSFPSHNHKSLLVQLASDVLLYNFFGTSPMKDQWRVIYGFMKERNWVDEKVPRLSFPSFSEARHNALCSELKQLYVAITRTRQRLWICENTEFSNPMFDYWKRRGLVHLTKLDDSVAQAMRVASSPQEWRDRGKKLFHENNFAMATMCFERAGDMTWEKLAKASGLRASAEQLHETNPEAAFGYLREAAEMFEIIERHESAASCYRDLGEYEQAGNLNTYMPKDQNACTKINQPLDSVLNHLNSDSIYLNKCGQRDAAECLTQAAELVGSWGDVLKEAELLEKAGKGMEAALVMVWYVFHSSSWGNGNGGWPLKQFAQKEELCEKAKSLSKDVSDDFYGFVCHELNILSDQQSSLPELKNYLQASQQQHKSLRGEIVSIRKILDAHLHLDSSKYDWEDELPVDISKHAEDKIFQNQVSVRTLIFYWNMWKDHVLDVFKSLDSKKPDEHEGHTAFSLDYFGVRKQHVNGNVVYLVVNKDADWVIHCGHKGLNEDGKRLTIDRIQLVFAIRSFWRSELVSVGMKVLETLEVLHKLVSKGSLFHESTCLLHIFEVSKFLLDCRHLDLTYGNRKKLKTFLGISTKDYFDQVFPLDWRRSVSWDIISLKGTDLSLNLLEEMLLQKVSIKGPLSKCEIPKVMMMYVHSRKPKALYDEILARLQRNQPWKSFLENFQKDRWDEDALCNALEDGYKGRLSGHISPDCFVYLLGRLLYTTPFSENIFFTTRSSFVESLVCPNLGSASYANFSMSKYSLLSRAFAEILYKEMDTLAWIQTSGIDPEHFLPCFLLKLVMMGCLLCLMDSEWSVSLLEFIQQDNTTFARYLPKKIVDVLLKTRNGPHLDIKADVVAEAFLSVEDPLLIVSTKDASRTIHAPCAMFVDLRRSKAEIMDGFFPKKNTQPTSSSNSLPKSIINWNVFNEITEAIRKWKGGEAPSLLSNGATIKEELDKLKENLVTYFEDQNSCDEANRALNDHRQLVRSFDLSERESSAEVTGLEDVTKRLASIRPLIEAFVKQSRKQKVVSKSGSTSVEDETVNNEDHQHTQEAKPKNGKGKGKKKKNKVMGYKTMHYGRPLKPINPIAISASHQPFTT
ncbi:hypothetical protein OSB04_018121 [Centaurea solstitialis]|uniref:UvrD-like helicase ATP-binding domain-containing protein n=1 Tax=Centaurea solstitialis TaxID=347529 RepID=A0AA38WMP0_9ASTR|nr:hypothetical protein OSB04_018121 [Centaurea solstitialis]